MDLESYDFLLDITPPPHPNGGGKAPRMTKPLTVLKKAAFKAIQQGDLKTLKECIANQPDLLAEKHWKDHGSLTAEACFQNQPETLKYLLEQGLKLPVFHPNGIRIWHSAIFKDSIEMYELLKKEGAVDFEKSETLSPLISNLEKAPRLASHFLAHYGVSLDVPFVLKNNQKYGDIEHFKTYVWDGLATAWVGTCIKHFDESKANEILKNLKALPYFQEKPSLVQQKINERWMLSVRHDEVEDIQALIRVGWNFASVPSSEMEGINKSIPTQFKLWQLAFEHQSKRCLEWFSQSPILVDQARADWKKKGNFQFLPTLNRVKRLEELGFDLEAQDAQGNTWLHRCFSDGSLSKDLCKWVVQHHASWLDIQNNEGQTPIALLSSYLQDEFTPLLERLRIKKAAQDSGGRRSINQVKRL